MIRMGDRLKQNQLFALALYITVTKLHVNSRRTEAAAADGAGHGGGADEIDDENRNVVDQRGQGFGQ